ncbi:hypothetical protein LY76DRAFT_208936 [Colletotrichum caudatum]|nr:hypothetical protein LY76DRAFT_208936 [Colletotrichum caudatum]
MALSRLTHLGRLPAYRPPMDPSRHIIIAIGPGIPGPPTTNSLAVIGLSPRSLVCFSPSCPSRRQRSGRWAVHHHPGPFSQPKQPRSPSILGTNGEIPRLRARKHGTPQSSRPRVRPSTWPNKPSRGHLQSPVRGNAAHDYMSKSSRTRVSCASQKKTGWLGKMEVTGKRR